ncbi:hypothetical protein ABEB36_003278 [Hypothenemus hampei]|uniref:Uncharacterized protein n=1 Tax=Hypothenemus hampei TaxID=57062 RepID=A0ABD1F8L4_HYPHA
MDISNLQLKKTNTLYMYNPENVSRNEYNSESNDNKVEILARFEKCQNNEDTKVDWEYMWGYLNKNTSKPGKAEEFSVYLMRLDQSRNSIVFEPQ